MIKDLCPAFDVDNVAIACSCSNEYAPYLGVYLESIIENSSPQKNYDVIVFECSITKTHKEKLMKMADFSNISLRFVNPMSIISSYQPKFSAAYTDNNLERPEYFFRLCPPLILRKYHKIIFTDVDLLFLSDPAILYQIDVTNYALAACKDLIFAAMLENPHTSLKKYATEVLKLEHPYEYFNTGVMIMNVDEFIKEDYSRKLLQLLSDRVFRILEQDALNCVFKTSIKYIDTAWNFAVPINRYTDILKKLPADSAKQYWSDAKAPNIIHWAGLGKPWSDIDEVSAEVWWGFARQTPFYEELMCKLFDSRISSNNSHQIKLLYILEHLTKFRLKKIWYKVKMNLTSGEKRKRYQERYSDIARLFNEAVSLKKACRL